MMDLVKGAFKGFEHGIKEWDEPVKRQRSDGTWVIGRPTRGFGEGVFSYAGKEYKPEPWPDMVLEIKRHAEAVLAVRYGFMGDLTFCLAGLYPTGHDGIPHHSDTVPSEDDLVVSISFGAPRTFEVKRYVRNIKDHSNTSDTFIDRQHDNPFKTETYLLEDGDCIIFDGMSQMKSTHAVPPVTGVGERVNLTFRTGL